MNRETTKNLVLAGVFTAMGMIFPTLFHTVGMAGTMFLPMHIPVLLCGLICGYRLGAVCGLLVPLLTSVLTGMPPLFPVAVYMMAELITYGLVGGLLIKKTNVILSLLGAMLCGRVVLAIAQILLLGFGENGFAMGAFFASAFVKAWPGIVIQIVFIPAIILAADKFRRGENR